MKICGIYKITNTDTGDFYIGSSKDVKHRWAQHKWKSTWKNNPNNPMYLDMQKYGLDKFEFQVIAEVAESFLKEKEQKFIETLKPTYNNYNASGFDFERRKEYNKKYNKSDKRKEYEKSDKRKKYKKEYNKEYRKTEKGKKSHKESQKKYQKSDKRKKAKKEYYSQLCFYNSQTITLGALSKRFRRRGIPHPTLEAKKYLLNK